MFSLYRGSCETRPTLTDLACLEQPSQFESGFQEILGTVQGGIK